MNHIIDKIKYGPAVLFLGQSYYGKGIINPLVKIVGDKLGSSTDNYEVFLEIGDQDTENNLAWLQNSCSSILAADGISDISELPWASVFTSSIDTVISRVFKSRWRDINHVYTSEFYPKDYLNRSRLYITHLYGCVTQDSKEIHPPFDIFEFEASKRNSLELLYRIKKELITPFGAFVIDGYNPSNDWVKPKELYQVISGLEENQSYIFSSDEKVFRDPYLSRLIKEKKLIPYEKSLSEYIRSVQLDNDFDWFEGINESLKIHDRITINQKVYSIPKEFQIEFSGTSIILNDYILFDSYDEELGIEYHFRSFLEGTNILPVWKGYEEGFNIKRNYEQSLLELINECAKNKFDSKPIILYGQSGTGKSIALGSIAFELKKEKKYPILYISNKKVISNRERIDSFCKWAEDNGAEKTIICWDGSINEDGTYLYKELNDYLISRGRNVIIIGTSYKLSERFIKSFEAYFLEAELELESDEIDRFSSLLKKYTSIDLELKNIWREKFDNNFLVGLYRLLPKSKVRIRKGIVSEVRESEKTLSTLLKLDSSKVTTQFGKLLLDAFPDFVMPEDEEERVESKITQITDYVSFTGQYGLNIPLDLLLRILGDYDPEIVFKVFKDVDYFKMLRDEYGSYNVAPRHSLEAHIVMASRNFTPEDNVKLLINIIENIKVFDQYNQELDFIVELIRAIGPNSSKTNEVDAFSNYSKYYHEISLSLRRIREQKGFYSYRTVLQEVTLIREYVRCEGNNSEEDIESLKLSIELLKEMIDKGKKNSYIGNLYTEITANYGTLIKAYSKQEITIEESIYKDLEHYFKLSQENSTDIYFSLDIWAWTHLNMLEQEPDQIKRYEIKKNLLAYFDKVVTENPSIIGREDYNKRKVQIDLSFDNDLIDNDSFNRLLEMGSTAGIYLKVKQILLDIDLESELSETDKGKCDEAIKLLDKYSTLTKQDEKCVYLLLKLKWILYTGKPLFDGEKQLIKLSLDGWKDIYSDICQYLTISESIHIQYLKAIAEFHLDDLDAMNETFRSMRDNYFIGARRIKQNYLASDSIGRLKVYTGTITGFNERVTYFRINELRRTVPYFSKNFAQNMAQKNAQYNRIAIGFNYLGIQSNPSIEGGY